MFYIFNHEIVLKNQHYFAYIFDNSYMHEHERAYSRYVLSESLFYMITSENTLNNLTKNLITNIFKKMLSWFIFLGKFTSYLITTLGCYV